MASGLAILIYALIAAAAYLIGSIPFSYIFSKKLKGEDIREKGSGNVGTTNALRTYGWGMGILTLVCDVLKGVFAALVGLWLGGSPGLYIAGVLAVAGPNFSVYLKFKGGKGIATTTGVLLVIQPFPTIIIFAGCVTVVAATRIMSVGSLIGLAASAIAAFFVSGGDVFWQTAVLVIAALGVVSHRENISRLMRGEENKLDLSKKS
jgi:glycerol-3-phosphate acyltransferase PlsY